MSTTTPLSAVQEFRNVAIVAHVDHGKTTLVDGLLRQAHIFRENQVVQERVMDSNALERERGITILAKNTAVMWGQAKINIVDTPGHADFGGEVERVLGMVDGVLLLVDAAEGPLPQTRFVLRKALALGLRPIVVINKVDRSDARPQEVHNLTFDLIAELGATEEQLDFPVIYAVGREGRAWRDPDHPRDDLVELFDLLLEQVPPPRRDLDGPFQMAVANLDYSEYLGRLAIGRISRGRARRGQMLAVTGPGGVKATARVTAAFSHLGLERIEVESVEAGDIVVLAGFADVGIGDTLADPARPEALSGVPVDEPTVSISFMPNTSPFSGREGRFLTSRHLGDRLLREARTNVSIRVEEVAPDEFRVAGRGELQLAILIETVRREGFEFQVSRPTVITREVAGVVHEPYERLVVDVPERYIGAVIETIGQRRGELLDLINPGRGRARLEFSVPARGLFGFRTQLLSLTGGEAVMAHTFDGYERWSGELKARTNGSLVAMEAGETFTYSLFKLDDRGIFFVTPGTEVYVGMVVGASNRPGDLNVNVSKNKKASNIRTSGQQDDAMVFTPPRRLGLEEALEYIAEDELVEVTPKSIRVRKRVLDPNRRK